MQLARRKVIVVGSTFKTHQFYVMPCLQSAWKCLQSSPIGCKMEIWTPPYPSSPPMATGCSRSSHLKDLLTHAQVGQLPQRGLGKVVPRLAVVITASGIFWTRNQHLLQSPTCVTVFLTFSWPHWLSSAAVCSTRVTQMPLVWLRPRC